MGPGVSRGIGGPERICGREAMKTARAAAEAAVQNHRPVGRTT